MGEGQDLSIVHRPFLLSRDNRRRTYLPDMSLFSLFRQTAGAAPAHRLSAADFVARRTDDAVVLDVRTPAEYAAGHVRGARNLDVTAPGFREQAAALDPAGVYYLYCRSGSRSERATSLLRGLGLERAYNVGGLDELARAGAEITR
jgi:rhodanese-related sulfurtransferase